MPGGDDFLPADTSNHVGDPAFIPTPLSDFNLVIELESWITTAVYILDVILGSDSIR